MSKNLRISKPDFMMNLLKDKGVRTGQLDARATGDFATYANRQPPYDDPSMGGSPQEARQSTGSAASPQAPPSARTSALQTYFTTELKFPTTETYRGLNLDINAKWKFDVEGAMSDPVRRIAAVMKEQPRLRVFWAAGYYDITTPLCRKVHPGSVGHFAGEVDRRVVPDRPFGVRRRRQPGEVHRGVAAVRLRRRALTILAESNQIEKGRDTSVQPAYTSMI